MWTAPLAALFLCPPTCAPHSRESLRQRANRVQHEGRRGDGRENRRRFRVVLRKPASARLASSSRVSSDLTVASLNSFVLLSCLSFVSFVLNAFAFIRDFQIRQHNARRRRSRRARRAPVPGP